MVAVAQFQAVNLVSPVSLACTIFPCAPTVEAAFSAISAIGLAMEGAVGIPPAIMREGRRVLSSALDCSSGGVDEDVQRARLRDAAQWLQRNATQLGGLMAALRGQFMKGEWRPGQTASVVDGHGERGCAVLPRDGRRRTLQDLALAPRPRTQIDYEELRTHLGEKAVFTDDDSRPRMIYEVDVVDARTLDAPTRRLIRALLRKSLVHGLEREYSAARVMGGGVSHTAFYTSNDYRFTQGDDAWPAIMALITDAQDDPVIRRLMEEGVGLGISFDYFHTHPRCVSPIHSGGDIQDLPVLMQNAIPNFGPRTHVRTHVVPLLFGGEIIFTFDTRKHRCGALE
jgi:hypothetical protein